MATINPGETLGGPVGIQFGSGGLFEGSIEGVFHASFDGRLLCVNSAFARIMAYGSAEEMLAAPLDVRRQVFERAEECDSVVAAIREHGHVQGCECRFVRRDGEVFWVSISAAAKPGYKDGPAVIEAFVADITERKRAEDALRQKVQHSQSLLRLSRGLERAHTYSDALNAALEEVRSTLGYQTLFVYLLSQDKKQFRVLAAEGTITSQTILEKGTATLDIEGDLMLEELARATEILVIEDARVDERTNKEFVARFDIRTLVHVPAMILDRHVGLISTGSFGEEGVHVPTESEREYLTALASHVAVSLDRIHLLDERSIAEEALRDSEERYRQLVELSSEAIFVHSADELLFVNPAAVQLLGAAGPEELVGRPPLLFVHPEYRDGALGVLRRAWLEREVVPMIEQKLTRLDGSFVDVEATITPFMFKGQPQILSIAHDITPRNRAEAALRLSESKLRGLLQNMFDGVYQTTADGRVLTVNAALVRMLGYDSEDELLAMNARDLYVQSEERDRLSSLLTTAGEAHNIETTLKRKDGQHIVFLENVRCVRGADGELLYFEGTLTDITERKRAETERMKLADQLRQAQRMESIGLLAAGIAHDFNNLLTPITGFAELLLLDMAPEDPRADSLRQIVCAADSARTLTRQLLAFGRKQVVELKRVTLGDMVRRFMPILRRTIREDIRMELSITPEGGAVMADVGQMEQVLTNLAVNAQDAMPEGGVLTIELGSIDLDESHASRHLDLKPGPYVLLSVSDTGIGMDRETQEHLFEPFFTRRSSSKGTGLGLSTVYGIVKQHDGNVSVYSEIGKGSTIRIYLPRMIGAPAFEEPAPEIHAPHPGPTGRETILLVEDDELVRMLASEMLSRLGYRVIVADSPQSCITIVQHRLDEIGLLLTDVVLPGMDGPELYHRLRAEKPDLRVLYMSGYTNHVIARHGIAEGGAGFIEKPLSLHSLAQKVRNALDS